jgi:Domain of unknown function (DUF4129)
MTGNVILQDPPVTPNGPTAQGWVLRELAKGEYRASQPTWFDRLSTAVVNWFNSLSPNSGSALPGLGPIVIVVVVAVVLLIAFLVFGLPRLNRRSTVTGELFGEDDQRSAAQILSAARAAAAVGDFSLAIIEGLRSIARSLGERTLVTMFPGTTAQDFARHATAIFPAYSTEFTRIATSFDSVRYLDESGTESEWKAVARLARELQTAQPAAALVDA